MGYDVHITRADDWTLSEESPISKEEWLAYLKSDAEFRLDGAAEASNPQGEILRYENEGLAVWTAHPAKPWFDHRDFEIVVKNPDEATLRKMSAVARALGAKVLGDEGEAYGEPPVPKAAEPSAPKPWWKRLLGG